MLYFWIVFAVLLLLIVFLDLKYCLLRDASTTLPKPYSYARVQLAWWMLIVLSSIAAILFTKHAMPTLDSSTLILLGISAGTTAVARLTDISDRSKATEMMSQDFGGENFFLDILSDKNGVSIHRLQAVLINIIFGVWFISQVLQHLTGASPCPAGDADCAKHPLDFIIPVISTNNLILLGLSSGTYAALKTTENKEP